MSLFPYEFNQGTRGKLSDNMSARSDTDLYRKGFKVARNIDTMPHGPSRFSNGTTNIDRTASTSGGWMVPMKINNDFQFELILDQHQLGIYRDGDFIITLIDGSAAVASLSITGGGTLYEIGDALVFTTTGSETVLDNTIGTNLIAPDYNDTTVRCNIPSSFITVAGDSIRLTFQARATGDNFEILKMYIAEQKTGFTDWFDINTGTVTEVLFSAASGFDIAAGASIESDLLTFDIDPAKTYILSWLMTTNSAKDDFQIFRNGESIFMKQSNGNGTGDETTLESINTIGGKFFNNSVLQTMDIVQSAGEAPNTVPIATVSALEEGGIISEVTLTNGGMGFVLAPTVDVTSSSGTGATITATITSLCKIPWDDTNLQEVDYVVDGESIWFTHQDFKRVKVQRQSNDFIWTADEEVDVPPAGIRYTDTFTLLMLSSHQTGSARDLTCDTDIFDFNWVGKTIYLRDGYGVIQSITSATVAVWDIGLDVGASFATPTDDWEEGIESPHRGFAACCTIHQNRFFLSGFVSRPYTVAVSTLGEYNNYDDLDPSLAESAFVYTISSTANTIHHFIESSNALQILTDAAEWVMIGTPAITPTDVSFELQTTTGSSRVKPLSVDSETYFISSTGDQLMAFRFSLDLDSYTISNYTIIAGDVLNDVKQLAYLRSWLDTQGNFIYCMNSDGTYAQLGISIEQEILGWSQMDFNDNNRTVTSMCVTRTLKDVEVLTSREDRLFMLVQDDTNRDLVMMSAWQTDDDQYIHMDNFYRYTGAAATVWDLTVGTDELFASKTVHVKTGDGRYLGTFVADSNSVITLNDTETEIIVGMGYSFELEPMAFDFQSKNILMKGQDQQLKYIDIDIQNTQYFKTKEPYTGEAEQEILMDNWDVAEFDAPPTVFSGIKRVYFLVRANDTVSGGRKLSVNFSSSIPLSFQLNGFTAWVKI